MGFVLFESMGIMAKQNGKAATVERPAGGGRSQDVVEDVGVRLNNAVPEGEYKGRWRWHRVKFNLVDGKPVNLTMSKSAGENWRVCRVVVTKDEFIVKTEPSRKVAPKKATTKRKIAAPLNGTGKDAPTKAHVARPIAREATAPVNTGAAGPFASTPQQTPQDLALHALALLTPAHFPGVDSAVSYSTFIRELAMRGRSGDRDGVLELVREVAPVRRCVFGG